jgi:membrane-bound ClpP family serine protease
LETKGVKDMLGVIAAVLIVLWLLGFLAFHVSSGLIHILLVVGIIMLLLHFFRGRSATA